MSWFSRVAITAASGLMLLSVCSASPPQRLTNDGRVKRDPRFVEGGKGLVYVAEESPILVCLMHRDLASGETKRLHPQAATSQFEPSFSADDRFLAYVEFRGVTNVKLVLRDRRENREAIFDPGSDRAHLGCPSVAPDGSRVIFSLPGKGGQQIVSVDMQAGNRRDLTQTASINDWPVYSPDGSQIAFGSSRDGDFEIYVMQSDGSNVRRLTTSPGADFRPAWSPDGRRLAFTSNRDGNYEIYLVEVEGTNVTRFTNQAERDDFAVWQPDGKQIVTVSEQVGQYDLYLHEVSD